MNTCIANAIIAGIIGAVLYVLLVRPYIRWAHRHGRVGKDMHKPQHPPVAESGGVIFFISALAIESTLYLQGAFNLNQLYTMLLVTIIAGIIGIIDDELVLSPSGKVLGGLVLGAPFILFNTYDPHLAIPLIGSARFTILYPVAIPIAMTVFANAANMSDTHNGVLHITSIFIYLTAITSGYILWMHGGTPNAVILGISFLLLHLVALHYNFFPAKVFNGDIGSLTVGTLVGLVAILGKVELAIILAMMPWVINGYGNIASLRGFRGRHQLRKRPVVVEGWEIKGSSEKSVPITLVRLLTSDHSLTEPEVIAAYIILSALASTLSLIIALFTYTM
ncbi:MAG: hypothetical protein F7B60_06105 [Desulfurococcales archaeon]|nr:hypothetical protein [Desulfurococcales archaeon]